MEKRVFMKPGKNNREDRLNFVRFWAEYVRTHSDRDWSEQQRVLIDSQINNSRDLYRRLSETEEGRKKIESIRRLIVNDYKKV
jgi:hypothetical protein